ncbi:FAD-dependent oxidoreductase [Streptomyces turgidiscabies]|uniref:2-polyprenyl-6-methoxyphenol hydroxylase-like FAD-dependent oxidoreductase n=1 Tax=Streptomyces turgidiscabies TaxID=85558 RepID=A0ABU0RXF3_9ACTN|nr:FAD-dependent oxidoreductase [Streptomyces turgidiscabies]MDQ0936667.1 2-polyprenyl-6-methoxyphenol hydroxylase-like FAD-dependent oxidoreductase [Streptomyces turgidiscabies]
MESATVLVVGSGPTGLTLAYELTRRGVPVRVIEKQSEFTTASRGKAGVQPRTLEVFDDFGIIDKMREAGTHRLPFRRLLRGRVISEVVPYEKNDPRPDAPYLRMLYIRQNDVEEVLRGLLSEAGCEIERSTTLTGFTQTDTSVTATLEGPSGTEEAEFGHLVGCDGGGSTVRKQLGLEFRGFTDETQWLYVGDVEVDGLPDDAWHQWYDLERGLLLMCPLPGSRSWQVQGSAPAAPDGTIPPPTLEALQDAVDRISGMPIKLSNPTWLSVNKKNVRMVDTLRSGRVLLAGDAAHIHPVSGALGANTGVQDAYNLGWKLARVVKDGADQRLLDTYQEERLPIAEWTLRTSLSSADRITEAVIGGTGGAEAGLTEETMQLGLNYRDSSLSWHLTAPGEGVQAGDRAPDSPCPDGTHLFDAFRGPHMTLLGLGAACREAVDRIRSADLTDLRTLHLPERPPAYAYTEDTLVLVRPDGHVGLVTTADGTADVLRYMDFLKTR